ncbi:hypothetical protein PRUPE_8G029300 [Prunus persica]|uniref:Uncharacterized protein n=1 Tax=Prunus persica TaxID=3760 RepID=A0A251MS02_PRUPE|nr:hypothetical protein PRUPE_8G029300 [Prunus persica]
MSIGSLELKVSDNQSSDTMLVNHWTPKTEVVRELTNNVYQPTDISKGYFQIWLYRLVGST